MKSPFATTFDLNSDIYEIGLIAAASPDFTEALIAALIAAGEEPHPSTEPGDSALAANVV